MIHVNEGREYLFVEVPQEVPIESILISRVDVNEWVVWFKPNESDPTVTVLPQGNWEIVSLASTLTEDQAAEIVDGLDAYFEYKCYQDYVKSENTNGINVLTCTSALSSLQSLLTSRGMTMDGTLILVKQ